MSLDAQMVVVIMDASGDVSLIATEVTLIVLLSKPGNKVFLLGIVHQVTNRTRLSFKPGKLCKTLCFFFYFFSYKGGCAEQACI